MSIDPYTNRELELPIPGAVLAEFACADEARSFTCLMRLQGKECTITGGVNLPFAVRPLISIHPSRSHDQPLVSV